MNLEATLSKTISKEQVNAIVRWIGDDPQRFDRLFTIFTTADNRTVQRAAWPMSYCAVKYPVLIKKHYATLLRLVEQSNGLPAVRRNILRLLDQGPLLPEKYHGRIMAACFKSMEDPREPIACRAFAIGILLKLAKVYPEIVPELKTVAAVILPGAAPGVKSRALNVLKA